MHNAYTNLCRNSVSLNDEINIKQPIDLDILQIIYSYEQFVTESESYDQNGQ